MDIGVPRFQVLLGMAFSALLAVLAMQPDVVLAMPPDLSRHSVEAPVALAIQEATPRAGDLVAARKIASAARVVGVTPELGSSYDHTTAPSAVIAGAEMPVEIRITNTGVRPWPAGGDHPVQLGYHWYDADGNTILWDGARDALSSDVASGQATTLNVSVRAPQNNGTYTLAWDLVQEGTGWFSGNAVAMKTERIVVGDGVTLYGKGWGHGVGLSQWGAQGWAEGAVGPRLSGEEIPLEARILAVCDAYAAMIGDRPYRAALTHQQAMAELEANAGTQFDPAVVAAAVDVLREPLKLVRDVAAA